MWIFLGDDFWIYFRIQRLFARQWIPVRVSSQRPWGFHAFLREGGPRILILRSIPSFLSPGAGDSWTNFSYFPHEGGLGS